jgi:hypothetical protein
MKLLFPAYCCSKIQPSHFPGQAIEEPCSPFVESTRQLPRPERAELGTERTQAQVDQGKFLKEKLDKSYVVRR